MSLIYNKLIGFHHTDAEIQLSYQGINSRYIDWFRFEAYTSRDEQALRYPIQMEINFNWMEIVFSCVCVGGIGLAR